MKEVIRDLKSYLLENFGDQKEILFLKKVTLSKPISKVAPKPTPIIKKQVAPIPKKMEKVEEPPVEVIELPPPSFIAEKPKVEIGALDTELYSLYKKIAPHVKLFDTPPKDELAKQIRLAAGKRSDLPLIPILFDPSVHEHFEFLTSLAKAINTSFGTSSVIHIREFEEKNLWKPLLAHSNIRLIIAPSDLLKHAPNLLQLIKEYPGRLLKSVEKIPLLTLSDISTSPLRKKEIWSTLTRFFTKT